MNNREIIIHVGFPKCASTFLQTKIIPNLKEYEIISPFTENTHYCEFINQLKNENTLFFKTEYWENFFSKTQFKKIFFSWEDSIGTLADNLSDSSQRLSILKKVFKDHTIKLIMIIRKQSDFLESLNKHYLRKDIYISKNSFLFNKTLFRYGLPKTTNPINLHFSTIDYFHIYQDLKRIFDNPELYVIPVELFKTDQKQSANIISEITGEKIPKSLFLNTKTNLGLGKLAYKTNLLFNKLIKNDFNNGFIPIDLLKSNYYSIENKFIQRLFSQFLPFNFFKHINMIHYQKFNLFSKTQKKMIMKKFAESNKELDKQLPCDLEKFGYY